jgi:hypothetical protein
MSGTIPPVRLYAFMEWAGTLLNVNMLMDMLLQVTEEPQNNNTRTHARTHIYRHKVDGEGLQPCSWDPQHAGKIFSVTL